MISLDVKSLYTNVPLKEAIDIALRKLYEQYEPPSIARKTMKRLLHVAVSQVKFKCNETWYVQKDGLVKGASLAVILANFWLKQYETALSRDIPEMFMPENYLNGMCPECNKFFLCYADNKTRTVESDPEKMLRAANLLHANLQFRMETTKIGYLDSKIILTKHDN